MPADEFFWRSPESGVAWLRASLVEPVGNREPDSGRTAREASETRRTQLPADDTGVEPAVTPDASELAAVREPKTYLDLRGRSGLFLQFADYQESADTFIQEYFGDDGLRLLEESQGQAQSDPFASLWWLRDLVRLWLLLKEGDKERLRFHIKWDPSSGPHRRVLFHSRRDTNGAHASEREVISGPDTRPEWMPFFTPPDVLLPTRVFLQANINENLAGQVELRALFDETSSDLALVPVPRDPVAALWLQFARAFCEDKTFRRCKECGTWFEVTPEVARTNRRFCSNACRSKRYRRRQELARQMAAEQKTVEEIAAELETDIETVTRWIQERAPRPPQR